MARQDKQPTTQISRLADMPRQEFERLVHRQRAVFQRWPLVFTLLGTFGFVCTLYGFEHIIDQIDILADNPLLMLGLGVAILAFTGTLYKKLGE